MNLVGQKMLENCRTKSSETVIGLSNTDFLTSMTRTSKITIALLTFGLIF